MSADILAAIDNALDDGSASEDAMRWTPEPQRVICNGGEPLWPERWSVLRHGTYYYTVTAIAAPGVVVTIGPCDGAISHISIDRESVRVPGWARETVIGPAGASATFDFKVSPETRAAICRMFHFDHPLPRRRYSRCPYCNPPGNPGRLAIDGREYARRRAARKKR
jgi:hypothetical protein